MFLLKAHRPERYGERQRVTVVQVRDEATVSGGSSGPPTPRSAAGLPSVRSGPDPPAPMAAGEEGDVLGHAATLLVTQGRELTLGRAPEPEPGELVSEPRRFDPPECREELDERDPGCFGCPDKVGRGRAGPRRPGWIEERRDVPRVASEGGAQGAHRELGSGEDVAEPDPELLVG
jgi:hypothetical protein